jgi:hypothetical protein
MESPSDSQGESTISSDETRSLDRRRTENAPATSVQLTVKPVRLLLIGLQLNWNLRLMPQHICG